MKFFEIAQTSCHTVVFASQLCFEWHDQGQCQLSVTASLLL